MAIVVGTSGWRYDGWRRKFYPKTVTQHAELAYMASRVTSIEINGSFYALQRPESYRAWREATPPGFVFSVKGSRFITHMKKLRDVEIPLANFFASGVLALGDKLGPFLWQFPEQFAFDEQRFSDFFALLPRDTRQAQRLARRHDDLVEGRSFFSPKHHMPLKHAVEIRSPTFCSPRFVELLRQHGIALVVADTAGRWPLCEDVTADFVYVRLHGDEELYASGYTDRALDDWATRISAWARGREPPDARTIAGKGPSRRSRDVYVYFDNDAKVHAPFDAIRMLERVSPRRKPSVGRAGRTRARSAPSG
jgi:uncharacterized protein YecE (DUF72 family)